MLFVLLACASRDPAPPPDAATAVEATPHAAAAPPHHGEHHGGHHAEHAPPDGATVHHRFDDVERWVKVFDDPERDAWQKPAELVAALSIAPGATVADIGAGTGYFNPHLAAAVGPDGHVIAVDIEESLVAHMKARAVTEGTANVEARLGAPDDPHLGPAEVDLVLLVDTYHHIDGREAWFGALRAAMKPGGRLVVVDFKAEPTPVGPPVEHRLTPERVTAELEAAGWQAAGSLELLPYQYALVFTAR